jgi:hypothetical protein
MRIAGVIAKPFDPVTLGIQIADLLGWSLWYKFHALLWSWLVGIRSPQEDDQPWILRILAKWILKTFWGCKICILGP